MRVQELQQQLSGLDPDMDVLCLTEDENLLAPGQGFRLLEITAVERTHGERVRTEDGLPQLKFAKSTVSEDFAILEVTSDF